MRHNLTYIIALVLLSGVVAFGQPTGSLRGHVWLNEFNGDPAVGATVAAFFDHVENPDTAFTATDAEGEYEFDGLPVGLYEVVAWLAGSGDGAVHVVVMVNRPVEADIILDLDDPQDQGSVSGAVHAEDGGSVGGAIVFLDGHRDNHHGHGEHYQTFTGPSGGFNFPHVEVGVYTITAMAMERGMASAVIEVIRNQVTNVSLILHAPGDNGDDSSVVELSGVAIVDTIEDGDRTFVRYLLDTDANGAPDYVLDFGPPDYEPGNGSHRPDDGDEITIAGIARDLGEGLPNVLVTSLNGQFWRDPRNHGGGGGHEGDDLVIVQLSGIAQVVVEDPSRPPRYFLDTNEDGHGDFRLSFGPPWYDPPSGAQRPQDGESIFIVGGLMGYAAPPMVVVYEINGELWRVPGRGHGGHGGGGGGPGCQPDSLVRTEQSGVAIVNSGGGEPVHYFLDIDADEQPNFILDFGAPDYDPGNGAMRPADGEDIMIVGGLYECARAPWPIIVVYEINGMFWREPGDTLGLTGWTDAVDEPVALPVPATHLMASNYPNPFNPTTAIVYALPTAGSVSLRVFDITGREVETLYDGFQQAGTYRLNWSGVNQPSGIYFYRVTLGSQQFTNRMVLLK
ncbi:carboxypeptidase regulatory-like domain-containing protein [candidate division KSB1 bacterium]|nr:carboxypeptidase regulatory-like domain-containing protein [candidate division KSB1 bacterium]